MANFYSILPGGVPSKGGAQEVGNKAWNLMRMAQIGLPVPPAFVLPTDWCRRTQPADKLLMKQTLSEGIVRLETATGLGFGAVRRPLLVSIRSGAPVSMPGMMETVLNVGLNAVTVESLIRFTGNPRLAWDSYEVPARFLLILHGLVRDCTSAILYFFQFLPKAFSPAADNCPPMAL
jgi:pyruvate,orthophosphate dikinase